jgi:isocitrate/isopropylmalate dehydrogenase
MAEAADGQITATLIPGDGIGSEIVEATVTILDALGAPFAWDVQQGGMAAIEQVAIRCRGLRWTASEGQGLRLRVR